MDVIENFSKRLNEILDHYGLSASAFADLINVQRSSISHVISGRNKPSLDFILKLNSACPDINLYWFLNGKGSITTQPSPAPIEISEQIPQTKISANPQPCNNSQPKRVERIVVFYNDGTFESYSDSNFSKN